MRSCILRFYHLLYEPHTQNSFHTRSDNKKEVVISTGKTSHKQKPETQTRFSWSQNSKGWSVSERLLKQIVCNQFLTLLLFLLLCNRLLTVLILLADRCLYNGVPYKTGETWEDGCDLKCVCEDGAANIYRCDQRLVPTNWCQQWWCLEALCMNKQMNLFIFY